MKNLKEAWDSYNTQVLSPNAPRIQRSECQMAFYGGAHALLTIIMACAASDTSDEDGVSEIESLRQEILQFKETVFKST